MISGIQMRLIQRLILAPKPCKVDNTQNSPEFIFNVNFNYVFICLPSINPNYYSIY